MSKLLPLQKVKFPVLDIPRGQKNVVLLIKENKSVRAEEKARYG